MRVYYFNDEDRDVKVRVVDKDGNNSFYTLAPQTGREFFVLVPADKKVIPFIKRWSYPTVLITYMEAYSNGENDGIKID